MGLTDVKDGQSLCAIQARSLICQLRISRELVKDFTSNGAGACATYDPTFVFGMWPSNSPISVMLGREKPAPRRLKYDGQPSTENQVWSLDQ
jgi:hypothetical protein